MAYVAGQVRELGDSPAATAFTQAVADMLPELLCWFGPANEPGLATLATAGFVFLDNEALRQTFLDRIATPLREAGIEIGVEWSEEDERWGYADLPWESWNSLERRLETTAGATA